MTRWWRGIERRENRKTGSKACFLEHSTLTLTTTVKDKGDARIQDAIKLRKTRSFVAKEQGYLVPRKSVFNKIIGDSQLELLFAKFLDECDDVVSYVKNYFAVNFRLDYVNAGGDISNYYPDFIVKKSEKEIYIVETKGQEELDVPLKMERLKQWCADINKAQSAVRFDYVPKTLESLVTSLREYKD